jgi:hypothetical protein
LVTGHPAMDGLRLLGFMDCACSDLLIEIDRTKPLLHRAFYSRPPRRNQRRRRASQQASALAYFDVFWVLAVVMVALAFVVLLMKRSVAEKGARIGGE